MEFTIDDYFVGGYNKNAYANAELVPATLKVSNGATGSKGMAITAATYFCDDNCTMEIDVSVLTYIRKELLNSSINSSLDLNDDGEFDVRGLVKAKKLATI